MEKERDYYHNEKRDSIEREIGKRFVEKLDTAGSVFLNLQRSGYLGNNLYIHQLWEQRSVSLFFDQQIVSGVYKGVKMIEGIGSGAINSYHFISKNSSEKPQEVCGFDVKHRLTICIHLDSLTWEKVNNYVVEKNKDAGFASYYYFGNNGEIAKFAYFPSEINDARQDIPKKAIFHTEESRIVKAEIQPGEYELIGYAVEKVEQASQLVKYIQKGGE